MLSYFRYFRKKGWNAEEIKEFVKSHRADYTAIGRSKAIFDLIPFVNSLSSVLFATAGALWAAEIENSE